MFILNSLNFMLMMFFISCLSLSYFYKHLLMIFIMMEFMMLNLIYNWYIYFFMFNKLYFMSYMLTMIICESIFGITLLIMMVRIVGNDLVKSFNIMKW